MLDLYHIQSCPWDSVGESIIGSRWSPSTMSLWLAGLLLLVGVYHSSGQPRPMFSRSALLHMDIATSNCSRILHSEDFDDILVQLI